MSTPGPFCTLSLSRVTPQHTSSGRGCDVLQEVNLGSQENKNRLVGVLEELLWLWKYSSAVPSQASPRVPGVDEGLKGWRVLGCGGVLGCPSPGSASPPAEMLLGRVLVPQTG